jgi:adenylate cyclase
VNAAFRLESATRPLDKDVAVGEATWEQMRPVVGDDLFERRTIEVKGYDEPMVVYSALFADIAALLSRLG